jgi:hypothetical protein
MAPASALISGSLEGHAAVNQQALFSETRIDL